MTLILSAPQYALIQHKLVLTPSQNGVTLPCLWIWPGLLTPLWTDAMWWKRHSMTFEAGSEKITQLLSNSSGILALGAARGYVERIPSVLRSPRWRRHLRHSRWQKAELSGYSGPASRESEQSFLGVQPRLPTHGHGHSQCLTTLPERPRVRQPCWALFKSPAP